MRWIQALLTPKVPPTTPHLGTLTLPLTSNEKNIQDTPLSHSHFVGEKKKEKESRKILSSRTRHPSRTTRRRDASQDDTTKLVEGNNPEKISKVPKETPPRIFFSEEVSKETRARLL